MTIRSSESVQKLCSLAVQQGLVKASDMSLAYQTYLNTKLLAGQCQYVLQAQEGRVSLQERDADPETPDEWSALEMPAPAFAGQWVPFASEKLALFDLQGRFEGVQERSRPELIPAERGGYVWSKKGTQNVPYRMSTLINPLIPVQNVSRGPYDFYFPADQDDGLFIMDRAAGTVFMTDLTLNVTKIKIQVREPGSQKSICMAYDGKNHIAYVTDHQTSDIIVIRPREKKMERISTPHGVLGNLIYDADRHQLMVMLADPDQEPAILMFSCEDFSHQGTLLIPGKRFSSLDDPCDLMGLSPDGKNMLVMSYSNEPALSTPLISAIGLKSQQLIKTHTLSQHDKPIGFAFQHKKPNPQDVPDFDDFIENKGLLKGPPLVALIRQIEQLEADKNKPLFDQDVESALTHIEDNFSREELTQVAELSQEATDAMAQESFFEWQGRGDMSQEEKQVLVERMAQIKPDEKVSRTNGVFVLNWLKGLNR